ncbi:hypothetical protein D1007_20925 [Hordeum vulgare]|nr:hypothetical protein D1007_20925 [Hordeum vulgare]
MTQLEAEIWIQNMENHFGSNLISRKYEVEHALQYFTQSAAIWWKMHHAIQGFSGAETWDEFKKTLLRSHLIQKCYDNPKEKTCACKICGEIGHTQEEHKDGCTHCEENHPAKECPSSQVTCFLCEGTTHYPAQCHIYPKVQQVFQQQKEAMKETLKKKILEEPMMNENIEDPNGQGTTHYPAQCHIYPKVQQVFQQQKEAMKETLKKKILEEPVMNENIEDPDGQGLTRFFSNAFYSCGEEGHYSQDCTKGSQEYLGNFPTEEVEFDPLEIEELAKKRSPKKGDAVYKGYPFMESGVELWYVEVHLHHVKGVCPKTMGQYFFISRVPRATFFDAVREAAMEAIRQFGEILEARPRHTQEYLSEVRAEMMEMKLMTTMMKRKMDDFKEHLGKFEWN